MNTNLLVQNLRNIPDFPKPGIQFKDVSTLFKNPECNREMLEELVRVYRDKGITKVVGIESRGFVMGAMLAAALGAGFVLCRKPGKLPGTTLKASYAKEYGLDATGGSMKAAYDLVKMFRPKDIFIDFIIELRMEGLQGREALGEDKKIHTLLTLHE